MVAEKPRATLEFNVNHDFNEPDLISSGDTCTFQSVDMTGWIITESNGTQTVMYSEIVPKFSPFTGETLKVAE